MFPDSEFEKTELNSFSENVEELNGSMKLSFEDEKLMHSVLQGDKQTIDDGKLITESLNNGVGFNPDIMFESMVKDYKLAKKLYGETMIRLATDYEPGYVERNISIPEFQRLLKEKLKEKAESMRKRQLISREGYIEDKGIELASLTLYIEELENIVPKGIFGERENKEVSHYGEKGAVKDYKRGDRYKDIALNESVKRAVRRGHKELIKEDLKVFERQSRGIVYVIYGLDASGSMKGKKLEVCKKAGIALAYKAISNKDKTGLVAFGADIKSEVAPTDDFTLLLKEITKIRASSQTDIAKTVNRAAALFPNENVTKHLVLITDALPTSGEKPEKETLDAVSNATAKGVTISLIGIGLDSKGKELAKKIVELGKGRLYVAKGLDNVDKIILEDYYRI